MDKDQQLREQVAREYKIALYRRYREKEASSIVQYEAAWFKRHRKAGNIPFIRDPGGRVAYFGYMLCDILIFGKDAVRLGMGQPAAEPLPANPDQPSPSDDGASVAAQMVGGEHKKAS